MKGIIVFSPLNDVTFLSCDEKFKVFVNTKAKKDGLLPDDADETSVLDSNVVLQMFSPLLNSYNFMKGHVDNPYHTIECHNGLNFSFQQFAEYVYMAVNGDGTETEHFLRKKLSILHRILTFLYGPVIEEVHSSNTSQRRRNWLLVERLLQTWCRLHSTEQSFLLEALERLYVNQQLSVECVGHLEALLDEFHNVGDKGAMHAILLVNTKLLALFSNKKSEALSSADVLLVTLLVSSAFQAGQFPLLPPSPTQPRARSFYSASGSLRIDRQTQVQMHGHTTDHQSVDTHSESSSHHSNDGLTRSATSSSDETLSEPEALDSSARDATGFHSPHQPALSVLDSQNFGTSPEREHEAAGDVEENPGSVSLPDTTADEQDKWCDVDPAPEGGAKSSVSRYIKITVMLHTEKCQYSPHIAHCVQILPGMVLVVLSEVPKSSHAALLTSLLALLVQLRHKSEKQDTAHVLEMIALIDPHLKKLGDINKRYKGVTRVERMIADIVSIWEAFKQAEVITELRTHTGLIASLPPRLESTLGSMEENAKRLFRMLFLSRMELSSALNDVIAHAQERLHDYLLDYKEYLVIKSQRNITINTYLEDFPGLVHFIYVDRNSDQMVAPSISTAGHLSTENNDLSFTMKKNLQDFVWKAIYWTHEKLADGCMSILARDGDYLMSYFIWFEDPMGNRLSLREPYKGDGLTLPGILTSDFYRKMQHECFQRNPASTPVRCYELLCIHIGILPSNYVFAHCRKLAATLWETSGASKSPLPFL